MMEAVRSRQPSSNLIPSGSFDGLHGITGSEWKPVVTQEKRFHASAEIHTEAAGQNQVMIMRAWPRTEAPSNSAQPSLLVQCPEVMVQKGDLLEITAKVRFGQGVQATQPNPLLIFDSDLGPEMAVSPTLGRSWGKFTVYREASESGPFKVWLGLKGPTEVYVDDFSIVRRAAITSQTTPLQAGRDSPTTLSAPENRSRVQGAGYSIP